MRCTHQPEHTDTRIVEFRRKELEIEWRKVELPFELASLGLRGTLAGALAGCLVVVLLAVIGMFSKAVEITGTHLSLWASWLWQSLCTVPLFFSAQCR